MTKEGPRAPLFCSAVALLLQAGHTSAQSVDVSTLESCIELETQALQLACFEAIIAQGKTTENEVTSAQSVDMTEESVTTIKADAPLASDVPTADEPAPTSATAGISSEKTIPSRAVAAGVATGNDAATSITNQTDTRNTSSNSDLGREQLAAKVEIEEDEVLSATVVNVSQGYSRELRFHLANGQIWRQIEVRHLQYPKNREFDVEISKGLLGAYRMRIGEKGRMVKIRRVQ